MPVKLTGVGLATANGQGQALNLSALQQQARKVSTLELNHFSEPLTAAIHSFDRSHNFQQSAKVCEQQFQDVLEFTVAEALYDAGLSKRAKTRADMPIFIGSSSYAIALAERLYAEDLGRRPSEEADLALPLPLSGFQQISNVLRTRFALRGPDFAYNTACTSSSNAIIAAKRSIESGFSERALVIGTEFLNLTTVAGFAGMQLLTKDAMRPFDARRNGLVLGDACAALVFERSDSNSGITLKGGASLCDTFSISTSNPDGSTIAQTIQRALRSANVQANEILAIKAHGTASPMNDNAEAAGMQRVFEETPPFVCLKPFTGHTLGACGAVEFALTSLALQAGFLPASGNFSVADENLAISPTQEALRAENGHYLLNYFGFGGNNSSLVLHYQMGASV